MNTLPKAKKNIFTAQPTYWWLFLFGLFFFEYLLFRNYVLREIVNYYPAYSDQSMFLATSYSIYENMLHQGFFNGLFSALSNPVGNTFLFNIQAALFFVFFGASRFSALFLNFVYFIALQIMIVFSVRSLTNKNRFLLALIFLGLLLATITPFRNIGGIADFRIDFMTFCLYGIFASSVIKSQIFLNRKWTIISALFAILLIGLRLLASVYIAMVIFFILGYFLLIRWFASSDREQTIKRLKNIFLFIGVICVLCLPIFLLVKNNLYNYYILKHLIGPEKYIRAQQAGVTGLFANLVYYPKSVLYQHLGIFVAILSVVFIFIAFLNKFLQKRNLPDNLPPLASYFKKGMVFLLICVLVPLFVLTLDLSKSDCVDGIVVVPILWLVMWIFIYLSQSFNLKKWIISSIAIISLAIGMHHYLDHFTKHGELYLQDNNSEITKMYEDIGDYAQLVRWQKINLALDQVNGYLNQGSLMTLYYEKHGVLLHASTTLGNSIFATSSPKALAALKDADVFIANVANYTKEAPYPFNATIKPLRATLRTYAEHALILLGNYNFKNSVYQVYVKPSLQIMGVTDDGWITNQGARIKIPSRAIEKTEKIILEGKSELNYLPKNFKAYTFLTDLNGTNLPLRNIMTINNNHYKIVCFLPAKNHQAPTIIKLTFSSYFIPKKIGLGQDARKLVLRAPIKQSVILKHRILGHKR